MIEDLKAARKGKCYQVMGAQVPDLGVRVTHKGTNTSACARRGPTR
jgi:hypothetical protein